MNISPKAELVLIFSNDVLRAVRPYYCLNQLIFLLLLYYFIDTPITQSVSL